MTRALIALLGLSSLLGAPAKATRVEDVQVLLANMNNARESQNLPPLELDSSLSQVAYQHAVDMEKRNYYEHNTPEGVTPFARMKAMNIRFGYAGENLAVDQSAESIFTDFWESHEHRNNMLGEHFAKVGIAAIESPAGTIVVEDFSD